MKNQITLKEAIGSRLLGYVEAEGVLVLGFDDGFVVAEASHNPTPAFEEAVELDLNASLDWALFRADELALCCIGELDEIETFRAGVIEQRNRNTRIAERNNLRDRLMLLRARHPDDFAALRDEIKVWP